MTNNYQLKNLADTKALAQTIAKIADKNIYLLLNGELASGKTQLAKFIGSALGVKEVVNSPTFVILNQYQTNHDWKLVHIDAYRLDKQTDFTEYFELTIDNFTIIEWPNKINWNFEQLQTITIDFKVTDDMRAITVTANNLNQAVEEMLFSNIKKV